MAIQISPPPDSANRPLRWAAILFVTGWGVHVLDHLRRGMSSAPHAIMVGGGSALLFTYAHLLPSFFPAYQDSFLSGPRINVTWFSWLSAVAEIGTGIVFAIVGARTRRVIEEVAR
jgi:hypothetical protein